MKKKEICLTIVEEWKNKIKKKKERKKEKRRRKMQNDFLSVWHSTVKISYKYDNQSYENFKPTLDGKREK